MMIDSGEDRNKSESESYSPNSHEKHNQPAYWWVNQGKSYERARDGGYLWAPQKNQQGGTRGGWTNVTLLKKMDRVFHYYKGAIRGISRVIETAQETSERPDSDRDVEWFGIGWFARVQMEELDKPMYLNDLPLGVRENAGSSGPFNSKGGIKQMYLISLNEEAGRLLEESVMKQSRHPILHVLPTSLGESISTKSDKEPSVPNATIYDYIASQKFRFPDWLVTDYILSLATKPLVILSGISGTGKTKLAQIVAKLVAPDESVEVIQGGTPVQQAGSFLHRIGSSTLTRRLLTIPVDSLSLFEDLPQKGERIDLKIHVSDGKTCDGWIRNVGFTDPSRGITLQLGWRKEYLGNWLLENASEGDHLLLTPQIEGNSLSVLMELRKATRDRKLMPSRRVAFLSVRPDWTDNRGLLGYFNPLIEKYQPTELLALLLRAKDDPTIPYFVILDEMNLAKVEYYFSDFLSAMESGTEMNLHDSQEDLFLNGAESITIPRRMLIPRNVFFTGTVNVDETTYMFSPKVLDRANVIEFNEVDLSSYPAKGSQEVDFRLKAEFRVEDVMGDARFPLPSDWMELHDSFKKHLIQVHTLLAKHHLHFGYRVANEIARYMNLAAKYIDGRNLDIAFDLQLLQKVLPKFSGSRAKLEDPLQELQGWCLNPDSSMPGNAFPEPDEQSSATYPLSFAKLERMLRILRTAGFVSFVE